MSITKNGRGSIKVNTIADIVFFNYVFSISVFEHSVLGNMALLGIVAVSLIYIRKNMKIPVSFYFFFEAIFIVFCICQNLFGIPVYSIYAVNRTNTMIISLFFDIVLFAFLKGRKNMNRVFHIYVSATFWGILVNLVANFSSILSGRFTASEDVGIYLLGIHIGDMGAAAIGWVAGIALFFSTMLYLKSNRKLFLFYYIFFSFTIIISGTRKMLIFLILSPLIVIFFDGNRQYIVKIIKIVFGVCISVLVIYLLVTKIPVLHNTIGVRIEELFGYYFQDEAGDSSLMTRLRLIELAKEGFNERPWFGWGLDNFKYIFYQGKYYAHNNFWEILVSGGVIGFILYYSKYVYILVKLTKLNKSITTKKIFNMLTVFFIVIIILEYWQVTYFYRRNQIVFIMLLVSACIKKYRSSLGEDSDVKKNY